jgi:RNA polymerase sigma-70 factor, ECF subfamily
MDEQEIIKSARKGSLESFNLLVMKYQNLVYRQAYFMLHDQTKADRIAQETFIWAYNHLSRYRGGSFKTWLLRITTNACLDEIRPKSRRTSSRSSSLNPSGSPEKAGDFYSAAGQMASNEDERTDLDPLLQKHLEQLDPQHLALISLTDIQGIDYEEAADILQIPIGTLKSHLVQARKQLCLSLNQVRGLQPMSGKA